MTQLPGMTMLRHPPQAYVLSQVIPCQQARVDIPAVFGPQVRPRRCMRAAACCLAAAERSTGHGADHVG